MARVKDPTDSLSPQAQAIYDRLVSTRGRIDGMYRSLLNYPELLDLVSQLGTFFRFGSVKLPPALREMAILRAARHWGAAYEWVKHEPYARRFGLDEGLIAQLKAADASPAAADATQAKVLAVVDLALVPQSIPADLQQALEDELGLEAVLELVALVGFYRMIAGVIFCFDVPLPEGDTQPF